MGLKPHFTVAGSGEEERVLASVIDIVVLTQSLKSCAAQKQDAS